MISLWLRKTQDFLAARPGLHVVVVRRSLLWNSEMGSGSQYITTISATHHCEGVGVGTGDGLGKSGQPKKAYVGTMLAQEGIADIHTNVGPTSSRVALPISGRYTYQCRANIEPCCTPDLGPM
ncbi:hypothetical protein DPMN_191684 [Dreissena polymorpha]|uniref:Uncharacterized protein n=1 Tax=Dreissena polymorpha TaxID=45954 RepID=A0A9D3Y4J1_DREPO|nr:hypothetical protein DPMN_191684 [Dreissena polymorpha]